MLLCRMREYVLSCPSHARLTRLMSRTYYMETAEMWSLSDLPKVSSVAAVAPPLPSPRASVPVIPSVRCALTPRRTRCARFTQVC